MRGWPSASQETGPHQGTESACPLISDFPASRTVRNNFLFFKPPSISLWQPELRHWSLFISTAGFGHFYFILMGIREGAAKNYEHRSACFPEVHRRVVNWEIESKSHGEVWGSFRG